MDIEFSYDNASNNAAHPNQPPKRVADGEASSDEMCEFGLQVLTRRREDLGILQEAAAVHQRTLTEEEFRQRIQFNPNDAAALTRLGMILWAKKQLPEAWDHLVRATTAQPNLAEAHLNKGVYLRLNGRAAEARLELETALRLDASQARAHQQLGFALAATGQLTAAEHTFETALEPDPTDPRPTARLGELRKIITQQRARTRPPTSPRPRLVPPDLAIPDHLPRIPGPTGPLVATS